MQRLVIGVLAGIASRADAAFFRQAAVEAETENPISKVAGLLAEMKTRIEADGKEEQKSYDKYACWCEDTLGRKAKDISDAKEEIESLQTSIVKLSGEVASHGAEIKQLEKDIAANIESQRDAEAVREKETAAYLADKTESEQCIGALEAAIKVLSGTGAGKKGFLETLQEVQVLSVVAGLRGVLLRPTASKSVSGKDMDMVRRFVDHPDQFVGGSTGFLSATQISNNPFGDYAPQSTQIQGILKGMYDTFMADLEKSNAEEGKAQKSHESLMQTKKSELETLQGSLQQNELDEATKTKKHTDNKELRDDTQDQLKADEELFQETKLNCKAKASEWAERTRLRTEELAGIAQAIGILTDPDNTKIFENATTTFLQVASENDVLASKSRADAYVTLAGVAKKVQSLSLAKIAVQLKSGGHFDKIMATIDNMVGDLRREEQDDIDHRNRCQNSQTKNKYDTEDIEHAMGKANATIKRLGTEVDELKGTISALETKINGTKEDMEDAKELRIKEVEEFRQAVKDDTQAIGLLEKAIAALSRFYNKNGGKAASLAQTAAEPEYDADKAPETSWKGSYGGKKGESKGVVAILGMIKEDLHKEIKTAREDDGEAQVMYEKGRAAMKETLDKQTASKVAVEKDIAGMEFRISDLEEFVSAKGDDLDSESQLKKSLETDCGWIKTHFESRRTKRKAEMDGLSEAKSYLAGVDAGEQI